MMAELEWPKNCKECRYYHESLEDEAGVWAPFCDLFHGTGIDPNCDQKKPIISKELRRVEQ